MDLRLPVRPDSESSFGFENAPVSKLLLLANGAATFNFLYICSKYHGFIDLNWPLVLSKREVWRLLTSQVVYDSSVELFLGSALMYHFRILERQWGSKRFSSFILAACTLTIGSHLIFFKSKLLRSYFPVTDTLAGGLYGPIFALLFVYFKNVYSGSLLGNNRILLSEKWLAYLISFRMLFATKRSFLAGILGLFSGILYEVNFAYMKSWLRVPDVVSSFFNTAHDWFCIDNNKPGFRKAFAGATEDIHDDLVYDYMLKMQTYRTQGHQAAQGHADVLQADIDQVQGLLDSLDEQNRQPESELENTPGADQANAPENPSQHSLLDDKIQRLVEMGFNREQVVGALQDTDNNIQEATNILLSQ